MKKVLLLFPLTLLIVATANAASAADDKDSQVQSTNTPQENIRIAVAQALESKSHKKYEKAYNNLQIESKKKMAADYVPLLTAIMEKLSDAQQAPDFEKTLNSREEYDKFAAPYITKKADIQASAQDSSTPASSSYFGCTIG